MLPGPRLDFAPELRFLQAFSVDVGRGLRWAYFFSMITSP
jgi:hypothetical protein